jgi:carboxylate-amine ligase
MRPKICDLLPRQGVPPAIPSWDAYAEALSWGAAAGPVDAPGRWWWELRPHPGYGTLELRVPDSQATVADAAAIAAVAHALVAWLAARHDAGELPGPDPTWRIEENRWAACRRGLDAVFVDLETGSSASVRELLARRIEALAPTAERLGCAEALAEAGRLLRANGAERQRASARGDAEAAARHLADAYSPPRASLTTAAG